ncbi:MAG: transposase, partial [Euryarchaeota archaeon]|nr:transposase [Euryarchaeota archaeon]
MKDLLVAYRRILQRVIDIIWENTEWKEKTIKHNGYETTRLIPVFPSSNEFKRNLRSELLKNWPYAAHYVDSAIKTAYSILSSWRQNYIKGFRRKKKPTVKREFVRVKTTLMKVEGTKIRVTIEPRKRYVELDFSEEWFSERVKGWEVGELIIKEKEVYITFKR